MRGGWTFVRPLVNRLWSALGGTPYPAPGEEMRSFHAAFLTAEGDDPALAANDPGVYENVEERNGIRCVSAVQAYLDLKGQPERAKEAAAELRARLFKGKR